MEAYKILETQMIILGALFGVLTIVCGLLASRYSNKKSQAAEREQSWTDEHKTEAAVRFQFHDITGNDLGFLYATAHIKKLNDTGYVTFNDINILAKESELYLPQGNYRAEIETNEYQNKIIDIGVTEDKIQQRMWFDATLDKKN